MGKVYILLEEYANCWLGFLDFFLVKIVLKRLSTVPFIISKLMETIMFQVPC